MALITGAARGQGRSHAVLFAEEGADIIGLDLAPRAPGGGADSTQDPLDEVAELVRKTGRRMVTAHADVRDQAALDRAVSVGIAELGSIDIVVANAGITGDGTVVKAEESVWNDVLDVNLTGAWRTVRAAVPSMIEAGRGGSVILTSSVAGLRGGRGIGAYVASKHGLVGLMRTLAIELGQHAIRVNCVNPGLIDTEMSMGERVYRRFRKDLENPTKEDLAEATMALHLLPIPWLEPIDVSRAVLFFASEDARYITGVAMPIDGGQLVK